MPGYPMLVAAIRSADRPQYWIAARAEILESRLSRIIRHGGATADERARLSRLLGVRESLLFASGPTVALAADAPPAA